MNKKEVNNDNLMFARIMVESLLKFRKESEIHKDSWKFIEIYKLRRFLKEHVNKWINNINTEKENLDLIDLINYCIMIIERLRNE